MNAKREKIVKQSPPPKDYSDFMVASEHIGIAEANKGRGRLEKLERSYLLRFLTEGRNYEYIQRFFKSKFKRDLGRLTIDRYRTRYAPKITQIINDVDFLVLNEGLARRTERIRRLMSLADGLEEWLFEEDGSAKQPNPKLIGEYRGILTQIGQEVGDIPTAQTNIVFANMSTDDLKLFIAGKLAANKDMSVMLAEAAGVRPADVALPAPERMIVDAR